MIRSLARPVVRPLVRAINEIIAGFSPSSLFVSGAQGIWLDPADYSTMFQDSAGTTPVTAVGQTVQLMLDKSNGLALGAEQKGNFVTGMSGTATDATYNTATGAGVCYRIDVGNKSFVRVTGLSAGKLYLVNVTNTGSNAFSVRQNTDAVVIANVAGGQTASMYVSTVTHTDIAIVPNQNGQTHNFTINSVREIQGNHVRLFNATLQSQGGKNCIRFNGTSAYGVTLATITPGTDKVFVCAGVRKASDAARGIVCEFSATTAANNGSFHLAAPNFDAQSNYGFISRGTISVNPSAAGYAAPITNVVSGIGNISGDSAILRINATQAASSSSDQGTGNYLAYNLYIGARAGTSLWFNGDLFGLVIVFKQANASEIQNTERFQAARTGIAW